VLLGYTWREPLAGTEPIPLLMVMLDVSPLTAQRKVEA
jgi:hypothetical protein